MDEIMNFNLRKIKRIREWIIFVAIIILMGVLFNCLHSYQTKQRSIFTTEKWMNGGYEDRPYMIDNLEKNYGVVGKNGGELLKLLGEPDLYSEAFSLDGDDIDIYWAYEMHETFLDGRLVYLIGIKNNIAVTAEIVPDWQL